MNPPRGNGLSELSVTIGKLLAGVETLTKTASEDRVSAAQYRTDMRREMREQSGSLHDLKGEMSTMRTDVDAMQIDVADYRSNRDQAKGAARLGKVLWIILVAIATGAGACAGAVIQLLIGPRPHG